MKPKRPTVLLVDDQWGRVDDPMLDRYEPILVNWARETGLSSNGVYSAEVVLKRIEREAPALVLLDVMFGVKQPQFGLEALKRIREHDAFLPVVMFTAIGKSEDVKMMTMAMEMGASEFLEKPSSPEEMERVIKAYTDPEGERVLIGDSDGMRALRTQIARIALSGQANVLVYGETGVGKTVAARTLHRQGPRRAGPFIHINCASIPDNLIESELFGFERGAHSQAAERKLGRLESANGGTLFLDEIACVPLPVQQALLVALQERKTQRVGGLRDVELDFQLLCGLNEPIEKLEASGHLRKDFRKRIQVETLIVPPLRERRSDIPELASRIVKRLTKSKYQKHPGRWISEPSMRQMRQFAWPGNVRELENAIESGLTHSTEEEFAVPLPEIGGALQNTTDTRFDPVLPDSPPAWERERLLGELKLALKAKRFVEQEQRKGANWHRGFVSLLYPKLASKNPRGCFDVVLKLTQPPWGSRTLFDDPEARLILDELCPEVDRRRFEEERLRRRQSRATKKT